MCYNVNTVHSVLCKTIFLFEMLITPINDVRG